MDQNNATVSVYPNPVRSSLTLEYKSTRVETVRVRVLNNMGSLIFESDFTIQNGTRLYTIPTGALAKGIYGAQAGTVTVDVRNVSLEQALKAVLNGKLLPFCRLFDPAGKI